MAIIVESSGNGVLVNGTLSDKSGWVLSTNGDKSRVSLSNKINGISGSSLVTQVSVDGANPEDFDDLTSMLGEVLFSAY